MTVKELQNVLLSLLEQIAESSDIDSSIADELGCAKVCSFERAGLMTNDAGVVLRLIDGSEFQITIVER